MWTASRELHTISEGLMDNYSESYSNISSKSFTQGIYADLAAAFVGTGFYGEIDALWGTSIEVTSVKSKDESASFNIDIDVNLDMNLNTPVFSDDEFTGYSNKKAREKSNLIVL